MRNAWEVKLKTGKLVVMVELTVAELLNASRSAEEEENFEALGLSVTLEALRLSVRKIDGNDVKYNDLVSWDKHFNIKETMLLAKRYMQIHTPSELENEDAEASLVYIADGKGDKVQVTVPWAIGEFDEEGKPKTKEKIYTLKITQTVSGLRTQLRKLKQEKKAIAQKYVKRMAFVQDALLLVDGSPVDFAGEWPLSTKETALLADIVEKEMEEESDDVGELKPVSGMT